MANFELHSIEVGNLKNVMKIGLLLINKGIFLLIRSKLLSVGHKYTKLSKKINKVYELLKIYHRNIFVKFFFMLLMRIHQSFDLFYLKIIYLPFYLLFQM